MRLRHVPRLELHLRLPEHRRAEHVRVRPAVRLRQQLRLRAGEGRLSLAATRPRNR